MKTVHINEVSICGTTRFRPNCEVSKLFLALTPAPSCLNYADIANIRKLGDLLGFQVEVTKID